MLSNCERRDKFNIPRLPIWGLAAALLASITGCAFKFENKLSDTWAQGRELLGSGPSENKILACAGKPYKSESFEGVRNYYYGAINRMPGSSAWCVLAIKAEGGKVVGYKVKSGNPGGLTDGSLMCAIIMDPCLNNEMLGIEGSNYGMSISTISSEMEISSTQLYGQNARNQAFVEIAQGAATLNNNTQAAAANAPPPQQPPSVSKIATPSVTPRQSQPSAAPAQSSSSGIYSGSARNVKAAGGQGTNSAFTSADATHCVEIVEKGFKCDGPHDRFMKNICGTTKIHVWWRLGNDSWSLQALGPNACYPVSYYRDNRPVEFSACSWDPKASFGPYKDPCRY